MSDGSRWPREYPRLWSSEEEALDIILTNAGAARRQVDLGALRAVATVVTTVQVPSIPGLLDRVQAHAPDYQVSHTTATPSVEEVVINHITCPTVTHLPVAHPFPHHPHPHRMAGHQQSIIQQIRHSRPKKAVQLRSIPVISPILHHCTMVPPFRVMACERTYRLSAFPPPHPIDTIIYALLHVSTRPLDI